MIFLYQSRCRIWFLLKCVGLQTRDAPVDDGTHAGKRIGHILVHKLVTTNMRAAHLSRNQKCAPKYNHPSLH